MKDLYLMRHGQTLFNLRRKIQGWCDSPLTEEGIAQARRAGELLRERGITFDHAYSSTAERACDTLEFTLEAAGCPLPYERLKGLRERFFGTFEGESEDLNPPFEEYDALFSRYGGETGEAVRERMVATLREVMERPGHERVIATSHAGACMSFLSDTGDPRELLGGIMPNCGILHFAYQDGEFEFIELLGR